jgi:hypothetical protein
MVDQMIVRLCKERSQVQTIIKEEVEALMRLGAEVCRMMYVCKNLKYGEIMYHSKKHEGELRPRWKP